VRFDLPAHGEAPPIELVLEEAAVLAIDVEGRQPAWIDVRDAGGACFSPLLDKHAFNRSITRDWGASTFVFRVPAGEYVAVVRGADGASIEQRIVAKTGERLAVDLRRH
jgi:hypothetical protein